MFPRGREARPNYGLLLHDRFARWPYLTYPLSFIKTSGHELQNKISVSFSNNSLSSPRMLKRYTSILFLCLANLVMLGHSVVPHHHHKAEGVVGHDHGDHADHHVDFHHDDDHGSDQGEESDHELPFSHFAHSTLAYVAGHDCGACQQVLGGTGLLTHGLLVPDPTIQHLPDKPPTEPPIYNSPHSLCSGLRAPPSFTV